MSRYCMQSSKCSLEVLFSTRKVEMSLHIFRLIVWTFVGMGQISMVLLSKPLHLVVVSVPKEAVALLRPRLKTRFH